MLFFRRGSQVVPRAHLQELFNIIQIKSNFLVPPTLPVSMETLVSFAAIFIIFIESLCIFYRGCLRGSGWTVMEEGFITVLDWIRLYLSCFYCC